MIDHDKYKGHTPGPWIYVRDDGLKIWHENDIVFQIAGGWIDHANLLLVQDAPLILAILKEVEEENAALVHDNADYVKTASELATENVVLRGTLRDVEILLRAERHYHVTDAAYNDTGSTIANCINIISQALNKAKGGE